jgi:hypothetical protein
MNSQNLALGYADGVNLLVEDVSTTKNNAEILLQIQEIGPEVNS